MYLASRTTYRTQPYPVLYPRTYLTVPTYLPDRTHVPLWPYPLTSLYVPQRFWPIETNDFITLKCS